MLRTKLNLLLPLSMCCVSFSLISCASESKDEWWNTNFFEAGSYYLTSIEGTNSSSLKFNTSSYFTVSGFDSDAEGEAFENSVHATAPKGIWSGYDRNIGKTKFEWFNCYLSDMPSFYHVSWTSDGQYFSPFYYVEADGKYAETKWHEDYPYCYENEDGSSANGVEAYFTLHEENDSLSEVKLKFTIDKVCDLTMLFSYRKA